VPAGVLVPDNENRRLKVTSGEYLMVLASASTMTSLEHGNWNKEFCVFNLDGMNTLLKDRDKVLISFLL